MTEVAPELAALAAEVARLKEQLADRELRHRAALEQQIVRLEMVDSRRLELEAMVEAYAALYEFAPVPYLELDSAGLIRDINLSATTMLALERRRLLGRPLRLHVVKEDRPVFLDHIRRCRKTDAPVACELRLAGADGQALPVQMISRRATVTPAAGLTYRTVLVDLRERLRAEDALRQRAEQLRSLAAELFRVEENERRELATLLHDDLGQRIVAAKMQLATLDRAALQPVIGQLDEAQATVRSLAFQLSPPILRDLGLIAGLRWLAREFRARYGLPIAVEEDGPLPPLAGEPSFLLFRCVRELLLNAVKHARATRADIIVAIEEEAVHIVVEDDGVGFDRAGVVAQSRSFGLLSVSERLSWLGGEMQVDSVPGRGTRVTLVVPRLLAMVG